MTASYREMSAAVVFIVVSWVLAIMFIHDPTILVAVLCVTVVVFGIEAYRRDLKRSLSNSTRRKHSISDALVGIEFDSLERRP